MDTVGGIQLCHIVLPPFCKESTLEQTSLQRETKQSDI